VALINPGGSYYLGQSGKQGHSLEASDPPPARLSLIVSHPPEWTCLRKKRQLSEKGMETTTRPAEIRADGFCFSSAELLPVVYDELRRLAAFRLDRAPASKTLQPTALVHEAWMRLSGTGEKLWQSKEHFFNAAAQAMRRILVDRVRAQTRTKRPPPLENLDDAVFEDDTHILLIHDCLNTLEKVDPYSAKVVLLKFYGGLSSEEISQVTGRSVRSVERQWMFAKAKLYRLIQQDQERG
jgi:RNA polymerase sigma factor (TIGR02999 family)